MSDLDRKTDEYRGYVLVARVVGYQKVNGLLWLDGKKGASCEGTSLDGVMRMLVEIVDDNIRLKRMKGPADAAEYAWAFGKIMEHVSEGHCAMLRAHYHAENRILTARQLAKAAGYANFNAANLQYGHLGRMISNLIGNGWIRHEYTGEPIWTYGIATGPTGKDVDTVEWEWQLRPEVAQALELLGWDKK